MQVILTIPEELEDDWKADRFCGAVSRLIEDGHEMRYSTYPSESWSTEEDQRLAFLLMDMLHDAVVVKEDDIAKLLSEHQLNKIPAVDANADFVRCKDCRYWQPQKEWVTEVPICTRTENGTGFLMIINGDGFCSYAERRTDY